MADLIGHFFVLIENKRPKVTIVIISVNRKGGYIN